MHQRYWSHLLYKRVLEGHKSKLLWPNSSVTWTALFPSRYVLVAVNIPRPNVNYNLARRLEQWVHSREIDDTATFVYSSSVPTDTNFTKPLSDVFESVESKSKSKSLRTRLIWIWLTARLAMYSRILGFRSPLSYSNHCWKCLVVCVSITNFSGSGPIHWEGQLTCEFHPVRRLAALNLPERSSQFARRDRYRRSFQVFGACTCWRGSWSAPIPRRLCRWVGRWQSRACCQDGAWAALVCRRIPGRALFFDGKVSLVCIPWSRFS